jgi:hypothetical protein
VRRSATLLAPLQSSSSWRAASLAFCKRSPSPERIAWMSDGRGRVGKTRPVGGVGVATNHPAATGKVFINRFPLHIIDVMGRSLVIALDSEEERRQWTAAISTLGAMTNVVGSS